MLCVWQLGIFQTYKIRQRAIKVKKLINRFLLASFLGAAAFDGSATQLTFTVDAFLNSSSGGVGVNTGINLAVGEQFAVSVNPDDLWNAGPLPRWSDANGLDGDLYATGSDESGLPLGTLIGRSFGTYTENVFSFNYGALIGELSGTYFALGTHFSGPAPAAGTLSLFYWDINQYDNQGSVAATVQTPTRVTARAVPEPGTMMLIGLGLAGLALRRRSR